MGQYWFTIVLHSLVSISDPTLPVGTTDIVAFGEADTYIVRNSVDPAVLSVLKDLSYNSGWRTNKHLRFVADVFGNRNGDLIGFGDAGVLISKNIGNNSFQPAQKVINDFGYEAGGWRIEKHPRFVSDLRNQGRVDIIGFGDAGVFVSLNFGNLNFGVPKLVLNDLGYIGGGWRVEKHVRLLGDVTGNGYPDIIGFGEFSVFTSFNNKDGTFSPVKSVLKDMCYSSGGWRVEKHPRFVADLSGDKHVDLIGFGHDGVFVSFNKGNGDFTPIQKVISDFGYSSGWRVEKHPRFIADLTGNKIGDIVGFGDAGVYISINNGNGTFSAPKLAIKDFGYSSGWRVEKHPRFVVDLTGDGRADILGFGENAVFVAYNLGGGNFSPVKKLIDNLTVKQGWSVEKHVCSPVNLRY